MRKKYLLCFVLVIAFVLSACGTNAEEETVDQELLDQYHEREAQAEEIAPRLEAALYGICDSDKADISVSNTSGTVNAFVEVLSNSADRADFGLIVSSLATRFIELPEEYGDYSFGDISLFYYTAMRNGDKIGDPVLTYTLGVDEDTGRLMEPDGDLSMRFMTPEEVYYYLSGVSPDTKSIPDPTPLQEASFPENAFDPAPEGIFSAPSALNNTEEYEGRTFYISGTVSEFVEVRNSEMIRFSTEYGDLFIDSLLIPIPEVSVGDQITLFFEYGVWNTARKIPVVYYAYHE